MHDSETARKLAERLKNEWNEAIKNNNDRIDWPIFQAFQQKIDYKKTLEFGKYPIMREEENRALYDGLNA